MHSVRHTAGPAIVVLLAALLAAAQHPSNPDGQIVTSSAPEPTQQEEPEVKAAGTSVDSAWAMLLTATHRSTQPHVVALAALGTMGSNKRAAALIAEAMKNPELDVRTAAILAAGQTRNRALIPDLRERLHDAEPQAVFAAAVTLWKMNDRSGEEVLSAIADGERKATPGLMHGAKNDVNHELHDPAALATLSATEGAAMLLGPFGFGLTAFHYMRKSGGVPARAVAIDLLAQNRSPAIRKQLLDALHDRDAAVRAAAAKALGARHESALAEPLGELFNDSRLPVRLTAAAAYINCSTRSARHTRTRLQ